MPDLCHLALFRAELNDMVLKTLTIIISSKSEMLIFLV